MEEVKTFNFDTGANSLLASVLPALANKGVDTGTLMAMCNKGNGFFGGGFQDIIALIVIAAISVEDSATAMASSVVVAILTQANENYCSHSFSEMELTSTSWLTLSTAL